MPMTKEQLDKVNEKRRGTYYKDKGAMERLRGTHLKKDLTSSPFIRSLEYGANLIGYWGYDNIIEQFEDCVDVIKVLYPEFESVWEFDQSSGHTKKKKMG